MSAKYERIKKADMNLPAPLRWLTRAFSSITLAVILLALVVAYGTIASVPVFYLVLGLLFTLVGLLTVGGSWVSAWWIARWSRRWQWPGWLRVTVPAVLVVTGVGLCGLGCRGAYLLANAAPFLDNTRTLVIYKLRYFEMTSQQFYGWWPFQTILVLFVVNMIWATLRRIEFKAENIGVLTVHTGIVTMAVGAMIYGHYRVSGDTILFRPDMGGTWVSHYYDAKEPAIYMTCGRRKLIVPLPQLPRYNDYKLGSLDINLDRAQHFHQVFPKDMHIRIPGFQAYAKMKRVWVRASDNTHHQRVLASSPAIELRTGDKAGPHGAFSVTLRADVPADRVLNLRPLSIDYLVSPSAERLKDLSATFEGPQGLVVAVPGKHFRHAYAIHVGQTIKVGKTGYQLTVKKIGKYPMPFASAGYAGAKDTRAVVHVTGHGKDFTRICFYEFPSRDQDFLPEGRGAKARAMGQRVPPDPAIHLAYIDASKARLHLIARSPSDSRPSLLARFPSAGKVVSGRLGNPARFPLATANGKSLWMHVTQVIPKEIEIARPMPVPAKEQRPKKEGTYVYAMLPVQITLDRPPSQGGVWRRLVWLPHMQYPQPQLSDEHHQPVTVNVPGVGPVTLAFSRQRRSLPFAMKLTSFHMTPYPGSHIPQNFKSTLLIANLNRQGISVGKPVTRSASLNYPIVYDAPGAPWGMGRIKISQIGWDAPNPNDPHPDAKNAAGQYTHQQLWTVLGIGNNVCIYVIALGGILIFAGIPWAFYVKPAIVRRRRNKLARASHRQPAGADEAMETQQAATADSPGNRKSGEV